VAQLRWETVASVRAGLAAEASAYAPWLAGVTDRLTEFLDQERASGGR
jgi:hypothetical protein